VDSEISLQLHHFLRRDPVMIERLLNLEGEARADQDGLNGRSVFHS
jgi:hypothetical protein